MIQLLCPWACLINLDYLIKGHKDFDLQIMAWRVHLISLAYLTYYSIFEAHVHPIFSFLNPVEACGLKREVFKITCVWFYCHCQHLLSLEQVSSRQSIKTVRSVVPLKAGLPLTGIKCLQSAEMSSRLKADRHVRECSSSESACSRAMPTLTFLHVQKMLPAALDFVWSKRGNVVFTPSSRFLCCDVMKQKMFVIKCELNAKRHI